MHPAPEHTPGELFIVATPIGNLADASPRSLEILASVDMVAAEDTRRTQVLLTHYGIRARLTALHEHNEAAQGAQLVERLLAGESVALVSDAGTPLLSDPGYRLVGLAVDQKITVRAVPGPSAITAALSVAGLPTDRFVFEGFLPSRAAARKTLLQSLQAENRTLVFFESSHRIVASLEDLTREFGAERQAVICRELTKQFETVLRGNLGQLQNQVKEDVNQQKGEFVLVVAGAVTELEQNMLSAVKLATELQAYLSGSQAARVAAKLLNVSRRELYQLLQK